jgi:predicted site-specific integrase-resolvase
MSTATATTNDTMSCRAAHGRLGMSYGRFMKFVALGKVRATAEPGQNMKFLREDVEKLAKELGR